MPEHEEQPSRVVTVSATYGAGGSVVAPRLAERLDTLFFDRLIHSVGTVPATDIAEGLTAEERRKQTPPGRVLTNLSRMATGLVTPTIDPNVLEPIDGLHARVVEGVHTAADDGGVILGRGAAVILAGRPGRVPRALERSGRPTRAPGRCDRGGVRRRGAPPPVRDRSGVVEVRGAGAVPRPRRPVALPPHPRLDGHPARQRRRPDRRRGRGRLATLRAALNRASVRPVVSRTGSCRS